MTSNDIEGVSQAVKREYSPEADLIPVKAPTNGELISRVSTTNFMEGLSFVEKIFRCSSFRRTTITSLKRDPILCMMC